jgi:cell wall-associated NlpC family hydrolase
VANLYRLPDAKSEVVTQAILGTTCRILKKNEGWLYVKMPDQYEGWVERKKVQFYPPDSKNYASTGKVGCVVNLFANLYEGPAVETPLVTTLTIGTIIEIINEPPENSYIKVRLPDGTEAWTHEGNLDITNAPYIFKRGRPEDFVNTAKRFLGLPYLWGGTTPYGLDCSGFCQLIYRLNGIQILRDADMQASMKEFKTIDVKNLEPADLIFFGDTSSSRITHVGMYIGNGQFIHSTTKNNPVVQISNVRDWMDKIIACKRWTGE